jgi:acetylglutamate kinase
MRIVIKFAGALLEDDQTVRTLASQVAALAKDGHQILVVHGGGRLFTATLKRMGIESKFVSGLRVTDRESRDVAVMVFAGLLNKKVSAAISAEGQPAVGISAADAQCFTAEPMMHNEVEGSLGYVGYLTGMNTRFIESQTMSCTTSMPIIWRRRARNLSVLIN